VRENGKRKGRRNELKKGKEGKSIKIDKNEMHPRT